MVASFSLLPLRFFIALPVLLLGVIGSIYAAYVNGDLLEPLRLGVTT